MEQAATAARYPQSTASDAGCNLESSLMLKSESEQCDYFSIPKSYVL